ncbi:MAG: hypothetical protein K2Y29_13350 [Beijerinckiaceae bacterium]|nr:hypothetical protein [Beijerinckiaceae bacterium]
MFRPASAVAAALLLSACVTAGVNPIVPPSPASGPPLDPAVVSYLANGTWRATKDPTSMAACTESALPSFGFVRHKGQIHVVRIDNGALVAALFTVFVSVLMDPNEILASAQSDGGTLDLRSTKGTGRDRSQFTLRFAPTGPDTLDLVGATASIVRDGQREDKSDGRVTRFRRCPDEPEQKKGS